MMGYEDRELPKYYIVNSTNGEKQWKRFNQFENNGIVFLSYEFLYYLYGDHINQIARINLNNLPIILRPFPMTVKEIKDQLTLCQQ